MNRIFIYELKRLIYNKFFLLLLLITGLYSYIILSRDIIVGIAFTAPFSPWSYGTYLAAMLPLLLIALLFFITSIYSNHEKQVRQLTLTTAVDPTKFVLVKCSAMAAAFLVISLFVILLSLVFYAILFRFFAFGDFIIPIVVTLIPGLLFVLGAGLLLGGINQNLLYVMMLAVILINFLPPPAFMNLYGGNFFDKYPMTLPLGSDGEVTYSMPASFILGRLSFCAAGVLMLFFGIRRYQKLYISRRPPSLLPPGHFWHG